jgi:acyl-CoA oxidase
VVVFVLDTGFELMDMLLCCKFAEGDSRILQMKLTSNRLKKLKKEGPVSAVMGLFGSDREEMWTAMNLARKLAPGAGNLAKMDELFTENWKDIYRLSELVEQRHIANTPPAIFPEPIVNRFRGADSTFDVNWKDNLIHIASSQKIVK